MFKFIVLVLCFVLSSCSSVVNKEMAKSCIEKCKGSYIFKEDYVKVSCECLNDPSTKKCVLNNRGKK